MKSVLEALTSSVRSARISQRKMIFINYFVQRPGFDYWKERLVRVKDGGTNFFEVRVDLASATCEQLYVHGEA